MNGIGISGAKGVGKEQLAEGYSRETGFRFLHFSNREMFTAAYTSCSVHDRVANFRNALAHLESSYRFIDSRFIADMTPVDVMANLYSSLSWMDNIDSECRENIEAAWKDAVIICSTHLTVIMHLQPNEGCPIQEQINATSAGLIHTRLANEVTSTNLFTVRRAMIELPDRIRTLKQFVHGKMEESCNHQFTSEKPH